MPSSIFHDYLARLSGPTTDERSDRKLWRDDEGRIQGPFFSCSLTSVFQPVRGLGGELFGFEAHAQSYAKQDRGLSVWRLLNNAASDTESIELDRLCRMLHVLNFFRQSPDPLTVLMIDVHERLLAAVTDNHGAVFRHIVDSLNLPAERIVLQLPLTGARYQWAMGCVIDSYRRHGFRVATRAANTAEALRQLRQLRPDVIRMDLHAASSDDDLAELLDQAQSSGVQLLLSRVDTSDDLHKLAQVIPSAGLGRRACPWLQGALTGEPLPSLANRPAVYPQQEITEIVGKCRRIDQEAVVSVR